MRITKNTRDAACALCSGEMKKGEQGVNFILDFGSIRRVHVACAQKHFENRKNNVSTKQ